MPNTKVLLSRDNQSGYKLEELLQLVITDIQIKSEYLTNNIGSQSAMTCARTDTLCEVLQNNQTVIKHLRSALSAQLASLRALDNLGVNRGPNHPRI